MACDRMVLDPRFLSLEQHFRLASGYTTGMGSLEADV